MKPSARSLGGQTLTGLYRAILKIHKDKLPPPMREMGDKYVRSEFLAHIKGDTTPEQWQQFTREWERYRSMLDGDGDHSRQPDLLDQMNPEQQSKMSSLYKEAKVLRSEMISDALPDIDKGK